VATLVTDKPISIPGYIGKHLVRLMAKMPHTGTHWVQLKAVIRQKSENPNAFDLLVFDEWEANEKTVKITDYASLDANPELIQFEGWFDSKAKHVEVELKKAS